MGGEARSTRFRGGRRLAAGVLSGFVDREIRPCRGEQGEDEPEHSRERRLSLHEHQARSENEPKRGLQVHPHPHLLATEQAKARNKDDHEGDAVARSNEFSAFVRCLVSSVERVEGGAPQREKQPRDAKDVENFVDLGGQHGAESTFLLPLTAILRVRWIARGRRVSWRGMAQHQVSVQGVPAWVPRQRLLDTGAWAAHVDGDATSYEGDRGAEEAADLQARLKGVVLDGCPLSVEVRPALARGRVRVARLNDARRRRATTAGFDRSGCRADDEGRWSLTPASIAARIGELARGRSVLDLGCGVGGNSIGFARAGCQVIAVERDAARLESARHNARVYGVESKIRFEQGDARAWISNVGERVVFVDPPWGREARVRAMGLADLPLLHAMHGTQGPLFELWAKVPASFDTRSVAPCERTAIFGDAEGDRQFVKFVLLRWNVTRIAASA